MKNVCHRCESECPSKRVGHHDYFYCEVCKVRWAEHWPHGQFDVTDDESAINEAFLKQFEVDDMPRWDWVSLQKAKIAKRELLALTTRLNDVATITIEYDGMGDDGEIDRVQFRTANGDDVQVEDDQLIEDISDYACDLLPSGWEINQGSFGELTVDLVKGTIHREHNQRIEDVQTFEDEL